MSDSSPCCVDTERTKGSHPTRLDLQKPSGICDCLVGCALACPSRGKVQEKPQALNCALWPPSSSHHRKTVSNMNITHTHTPPTSETAAWFHSRLDGPSLHPDENGPIPPQPRLCSSVMTTLSHTYRSALLRTTILWNVCQPGRCRQNSHPPATEKKEGQQVPLGQCWHTGTSVSTARRKRCSPKLKNVTGTFSQKG